VKTKVVATVVVVLAQLMFQTEVLAQTVNPGDGLTGANVFDLYASEVEQAAAIANQSTFERYDTACNPGDIYVATPSPVYNPADTPGCSQAEFNIYLNSRELVHTANAEPGGTGTTIASLDLNVDGLSQALRWTAAEEMAAQGSMVNEFTNDQLGSMGSRIAALRMGATGFSIAGMPLVDWNKAYAANDSAIPTSQGVEAQALRERYSPWGGFIDGSFGWGNRLASPQEDAFDFEDAKIGVGVDYRVSNRVIVGAIFGYTSQEVDFDEAASSQFVVDGGIEAEGLGLLGFGLFNWGRFYADFSLGYQSMDLDTDRRIKYPSNNINVDAVNQQTFAEAESSVLTGSLGLGYTIPFGALSIDPYLSATYRNTVIDKFTENQSINLLGSTGENETRNFELNVDTQDYNSFETRLGLRLAYVFTPWFGTLIPQVDAAWNAEHDDAPRVIQASYVAFDDAQPDDFFNVFTQGRDDSWYTWSIGFSSVVRGGRQTTLGGPIKGGLQLWLKYMGVENYEYYDNSVLAGGMRYEF
jgi:outer membrane autotransporter protein